MSKGVAFGDYHSWDDWDLFCTKIEIDPPKIQHYTVDVPGRDGALDLTEALFGGDAHYYDREMRCTFDVSLADIKRSFWDILSEIQSAIHGRRVQIVLDEDPDYYWDGFCSVDGDDGSGEIEITAECRPYKYYASETELTVEDDGEVVLPCDRMDVVPTVTVTAETIITCGSSSLALSAGTYSLTGLQLSEGGNTWQIESDGTTTITYRQGRL